MKHLKLFFALLAMLALGVTNAWGETATLTFSAKCGGKGTDTKGYNWTIASDGTESNFDNTKGIHYGTSSAKVKYIRLSTSDIPGTITNVNVNASTGSGVTANLTVKVGSSDFTTGNSVTSQTLSTSATEYNFSGSASGEIIVEISKSSSATKAIYCKSVVVTYETSGSTKPALSSIQISGELTKDTYEEGEELDLTGLTVQANYESGDPKDVTNEVDWSYTPNPLTKGTTSVDVTATYEGLTAIKTINDLTVTEHVVTPGEYDITLNNVFFGTTENANITGSVTGKQNDITITINGTGSTKPRTDATYTRFYANSTMAISVPTGYVIKSIAITKNESDYANPSVTIGAFDNSTKTWTGTANSVTMSFSSKSFINPIKVIYAVDVKHTLNITTPSNGTLVVKDGSAELANGAQVYEGTKLVVTPTPNPGYLFESLTVDGTPVDLTEGSYNLTMPAANVTIAATFKANEKPDATLTLSKNGETEDITGYKQDDKVTLPSITSDCVKEFVGWDANASCATEPEYKAGDEYTLASTTQTLYAVYADGEEGAPVNKFSETFDNCNGTGGNDGKWSGSIASAALPDALKNTWTVANAYAANKCAKFGGSSNKQGSAETPLIAFTGTATLTFSAAAWEGTDEGTTLNISATGATLNQSSVTLTKAQWTTYTVAITEATGAVKIKFEANNASNNRFFLDDVVVSQASVTYSNYSTTCTAAPKAEVNPTEITATATGVVEGKVTVTYEHVNTEGVAVALFNDEACTEAFSADWLTASLDGEKNVTYTIKENTTYAERKAYIQLTAPETTGATEPAVVVIPVIQAGKDKVFASLEALLAAITPTTEGVEVTVTLTNEVIKDFNTSGSSKNGIALNVPYQGGVNGVKEIEIYCTDVPADWVKGGKVSGTITCPWKDYYGTWELCPNTWEGLTYTAPATVKSIAVSGTPTKTTYIDGEAFDPTGLVVTATLTDDSTEPIVFALVDWTFDPATLSTGQTSVNVTAKYNSVSSAPYEVTGLTVNDIPTKTVAEFIAAGGGRCYLEGIVSNISNTTYGNFDLTDASGKIYVYGCLNGAGESKKFAELGVKNGDKIKVVADEYELYQTTTPEAKNVQYVSHISAATITISNITMEVDEVKNISATVEPAEAEVTYTIKENTGNAISLSGNTITARAVGTATITATVENGATYMGNSVDFTVTVGPKTEKTDVVILAEHNGQWYALKAEDLNSDNKVLAALAVTYFNGTLYNVNESDKGSITWTRTVVGDQVTFKNGTNYLYVANPSKTELSLNATAFSWTYDAVLDTYTSNNGARTFLYSSEVNGFKNFAINNNVGTKNYSGYPVVTAPGYTTGDPIYTRTVTNGNYGTICIPYASTSYSGAEFYEVSWLQKSGETPVNLYLDQLAAGTQLEAGKPYIFRATSTEIQVTCTGAAVTTPVEGVNGLTGTFKAIPAGDLTDMLVIAQNKFWTATAEATAPANRAYINPSLVPTSEPDKLPGRRRVALGAAGENEATGMDNITTTDTPVKVIENGQLIIIRDGVKYNVQGVRL